MNRIFTVLGIFLLFSFHLAAQTITGVSIPAGNYKINDAITINFVSANTAGTALVAGSTVNGVALTGFTNLTGGNYSAIYTVVATNTDRASVGVIPINIGLTSGTDGPFFTAAATSGGTVTIDGNSPTVSSIVKASTDPSNATNINFTVTFNELVDATTLTTADFDLTLTGGVTATVNSVTPTTGTSTTFTVNVNAISTNEGTLRLNKTNNAYSDAIGNSSTATFSAGEVYTIDRLAPTVSSIVKASTDPSNATNVNFTVTFNELVDATTLTTADFDLTLTGGVTATVNSVTPTTGTSTTFTVNVNTISTNEGTLRLNKTNNAYSDAIGNSSTATFSPGAGGTYSIDRLAQSVSSIVRASTNPSNATNVNFTVTFSELIDATTLTTADFDLTLTGGVTATINSVLPTTGTSTTFTVNVNAISANEGTLRLNKTNDAYSDAIGNSSTATFSAGEVYTIDRLAPTVSGIVRASADPTGASNVDFTVTFNELVDATTLTTADFDLTLTGGVTATVNSVTPATGTSATFTVNVNAISNNQGTLQLNKTNNAYSDAIGNSSTATFSAGEVYTIDRLAPTADAPDAFQTVQSLKSGATSASQVRSTKNGAIYLVKNGTAVTSQAQINAAVTAKNAFLGRAAAVANTGYTITIPIASLINDGNYNIVAVDGSGNVSNPSSGADSWLTVDNTAPTVAITLVSASPTTASAGFLDFTVTFSESVTGVDITDFVLASATVNDAIGTISNLSGSGSSYTVTVNTLASNYANGTQAILNLDIIGSPGIADLATNSFGGSVTTDAQYLVDNTKPTVVQNDFTFNANGAAAETVVFTVSEPLNGSLTNNIAGFVIGGGSGTTNPIGVYNAGNGTVTLTNGGANATWGPGITVSYTPGNMSDLLANTMLAIGATPVSVPNVSLQAGDIAFTNINTRTGSGTGTGSGNGFSFVLLKNLPASTKIFFTNRGWDGTQLQAAGIDMTWTSPGSVTNAGTEVYFNGSNFVSGSNAVFGTAPPVSSVDLPDNGDQILAYQGSLNSPLLFIAAININSDGTLGADNWNTAASVGTDVNRSALPPGLTEGTNAISLALLNSTNVLDNGQYKLSGVAQEGSAQQLRSAMCTAANWNNRDANAYSASGVTYRIRPVITAVTIPNGTNYIISGTPYTATITVHDDRGSAHTLLASNIDGFSLSNLIRTNSTTYTADFTVTEGGNDVLAANNIPISVNLQSAQGNATAAVTPINTVALFTTAIAQANDPIDANSPHVVSINRQSSTNAWSTSGGTSATTVVFRVTFSDDMASLTTLAANDFAVIAASGLAGAPSINNIAAVTGTKVFDISVTGYTGTGTIGLNYVDSEAGPGGSVTDLIGNPTKSAALAADGSFTGQTFSIVLPTPASEVFTLTESNVTGNSVTLTWNPTNPLPAPTNYLVLAKPATPPTAPADGTPVADGTYAINLPVGTNTHTFTLLQSGTSYNFAVYKYALSANNSPDNIDYETTSPAIKNAVVTNTAVASSILLNSTPVDIGSIKTTSGTSVEVMNFTIFDDGQDPLVPNAMTLRLNGVSQETITFTLRGQLTLLEGADVTGFTSSTGTVGTAKYTGRGTTNTITLTNVTNGTWTAGTTISYSAISGNAVFSSTVGKMQPIVSHPVAQAVEVVDSRTSNGTFTVPLGVTSIVVEAWGGGGGGGSGVGGTFWDAGGGGGGGGYSRSVLNVTPGTIYNLTVGSGGNFNFGNGLSGNPSNFDGGTVVAFGGTGGNANTGGNSGTGGAGAVSGIGDITFTGGAGRQGFFGSTTPASAGSGGGGGSSAGINANGIAASGTAGSIAATGGGNGGSGITSGTGLSGFNPGGGGGGSGNGFGGSGGDGKIVITYSNPVAPSGSSDWVGDNSPFKISQLIITQETTGTTPALIGKLNDVIAGAELSCASCGGPPIIATGTVNPSDITFTSLSPTGSAGEIGVIPDANGAPSSKTYSLKVWLRTDIEATDKLLAATIDGMTLNFKIDPANVGSIGYDDVTNSNQKSSRLMTSHPALASGANEITVDPTHLDFSTNPNPSAFVLANVTAGSVQPDLLTRPVVRARDVHGNTDKDYSATSLAITTTGGMSTTPNTLSMAAGVAAFPSTFQYQDDGDGTLTVSDGSGGLVDAVSSTVTVTYSNTTSITVGAAANISSLKTAAPYFRVFDFNIIDDNGSGGDGAPTRFNNLVLTEGPGDDFSDWSEAIPVGGAQLFDGTNSITGIISTNTITFSGINVSTLGYIADNATKTYQLRIYLKASLGGTLPDDVDGKNFVFRVQDIPASVTTDALSSAFTGANDINSGSTNISVNVDASKLQFSADPASTLLVGKDVSAQLPIPVIEALDANNNRDLSYNSATVTVTNSGSLTMANVPGNASFINGLLTFPGTFKFTTTGTGVTLNVASTGPSVVTSTSSTSFDVRGGDAGTITASSALTEPPTISSLVDLTHTPAGLPVFDFTINDDPAGTPAGEDDGNPTQLTSLFITSGVGNTVLGWDDAFATATLSDGTNTVTVTNIDASDYFYFDLSSLTGQALGLIADNGSKTYTLRVWLKTALGGMLPTTIDGENLVFDVQKNNITTGVNSSKILTGQNQNSGPTNNKVDVTATRIDYSQLDATDNFISPYSTANFPASGSIFTDFIPRLGVEAHDANSNRDLGFAGSITFFAPVTAGVTTQNDPSGAFTNGTLKFPANFNYTAGSNQDGKLRMSAGSITNQDSPTINIISSFESQLISDNTINHAPLGLTQDIDFINYQATDITTTSATATNGYILDLMYLYDGGTDITDLDGAPTNLDDLTLGLSNWQSIRRIAIYTKNHTTGNVVEVSDYDITDPALTPTTINGYRSITFTNLNIAAPDNDYNQILILATFQSTPTAITDRDDIKIAVLGATLNVGSKFAPDAAQTGTIGGVATSILLFPEASGPAAIVGTKGYLSKLQVTATSLDFTTQATTISSYAGVNEPVGNTPPLFTVPYASAPLPATGASIVSARDKFANVDTDFNYTPAITQTAGPNTPVTAPRNFVNGILRLDGMEYTSTGNGTLKVVANGIDSSNPLGAIPGALVNVVNVAAALQTSGVLEGTGIPATYSIKGGSLDQTIFGVTFTASGATASEPTLKQFSISFNKSFHSVNGGNVTDIFTNFRVLQGTTNISSIGGSLSYSLSASSTDGPGSRDIITVDLTSNPQPLFNGPITYYLVADVDPTANLSTPSLTPSVVDKGYGSTTDSNIVVSRGTASGDISGNVYTFASTKPPILLTAKNSGTIPYSGQLNVDAGLTQIKLKFDVAVTSLDGGFNEGAELYNRTTNEKVADLIAVPGLGNYLSTNDEKQVINPLTFDLKNFTQPLQADEVYYVTIKKGSFDPIALKGTGISDQGLNFFGGISSNAILYFKIASDKPLKLNDIKSTFNNQNIGTLSSNFDQFGTAYYLAVPTSSPAPTNDQVKNPAIYLSPKVASGSYIIDRINALQTVSFLANYTLSQTYNIYIYAENDAPTPVPSGKPVPNPSGGVYGQDQDHTAGSGGYTLQITLPGANNVNSKPDYLICPNSFVTLSEPIIIGESTPSEFKSVSVQNFNILLPTGYEFDITTAPSVQLIGTDFGTNIASMNFVSNTVLNISYTNNPFIATSTDYILISNMRIKGAAGSTNKPIQRFYGSNTLTPPVTTIANIGLVPSTQFNFTNSYSETNKPFPTPSPAIVNSIPDNYIDNDPKIAGSVRLNPEINVSNDYNGSTFSGTGVTNDLLTLSAVPNNTSFNIVMTHVDPNGCISQKSQQYLVYDHRGSISKKLGTAYTNTPQEGTAQALVNVNFPNGNSPVIASPTILHNELAGYRLINLSADLPASEIRLNEDINGEKRSQIISGAAWRARVKDVTLVPTLPPAPVDLGTLGIYYDYTWDYSHILNAVSESNNTISVDPYDGEVDTDPNSITNYLFRKRSARNTYWTGGSLGKIEFTGVYRSSADLTVVVPFRQQVELFVPPVPVIEVGLGNQTFLDTADPLNPVSPSNSGTPIFCEQGGAIAINGFPAASATSTGVFDITNLAGVQIPHHSLAFVDNGNGTATLYPYLISGGINVGLNNNYQDFKITYRFQENNSPAFGTSSIIVRVSPNPIAKFTLASSLTISATGITPALLSDGMASDAHAYCAGIPIEFSPVTDPNIKDYNWDFGDNNSASNLVTTNAGAEKINNIYRTIGTYRAQLTTVSNLGCNSINTDNVANITVGSIPAVDFDLTGISKADQITFTDKSTAASNATSFSRIDKVLWNYGDAATESTVATHNYTEPGHYNVRATVTTAVGPIITSMTDAGCSRSFERHIVILDKKTGFYEDDFESVTSKWQTIKDSLTTNVSLAVVPSSWKRGMPGLSRAYIKSAPVTGATNNNVWATGLTGTYLKNERSFLYSPSIDMTGFLRPMISFDANKALGKDGVVLEYSTDNLNVADPNKVWTTVGNNTTGVNWFNDQIIGSKPGKQSFGDFGWSGSSTNADTPKGWMESKHELLNAISTPTNQRTNVVFRFSFATINDGSSNEAGTGSDGFAMDNFRIGERTRTILLENFTTTNAKDAAQISLVKSENSFISGFIAGGLGTTVVKLNYHIGFTGNDPFNLDNPADPSARALYYNVKNVPWAFLDGNRPAIATTDSRVESWAQKAYDSQTLQLGQAEINVPPFITNPDGSIKFSVEVKALYDLPVNTVVHVAVIEQSILRTGLPTEQQDPSLINTGEKNFDYVLKKMLPNALGTKLGALAKGMPTTPLKFEYYPDPTKLYKEDNDLAIIVFLQNEDTKTIYQTEYVTGIADPSSTITGVETPLVSLEDVSLYPNPADHELTILLPRKAISDVTIQLFDQVGKSVLNSTIKNGEQKGTLNVQGLAESMYLMRLVENGEITMKKVMVVHQN